MWRSVVSNVMTSVSSLGLRGRPASGGRRAGRASDYHFLTPPRDLDRLRSRSRRLPSNASEQRVSARVRSGRARPPRTDRLYVDLDALRLDDFTRSQFPTVRRNRSPNSRCTPFLDARRPSVYRAGSRNAFSSETQPVARSLVRPAIDCASFHETSMLGFTRGSPNSASVFLLEGSRSNPLRSLKP